MIWYLLLGYALWCLYVFTMGVYRARMQGRLHGFTLVMAFPIVLIALVVDCFVNLIPATLFFFDLPREWLLTSRFQRYIAHGDSWRGKVAKYVCDNLLDVFDPRGNHC